MNKRCPLKILQKKKFQSVSRTGLTSLSALDPIPTPPDRSVDLRRTVQLAPSMCGREKGDEGWNPNTRDSSPNTDDTQASKVCSSAVCAVCTLQHLAKMRHWWSGARWIGISLSHSFPPLSIRLRNTRAHSSPYITHLIRHKLQKIMGLHRIFSTEQGFKKSCSPTQALRFPDVGKCWTFVHL